MIWEFEAKLRPVRPKRPDQNLMRWKLGDLLENKERQAAYAASMRSVLRTEGS